MTQRRKRVASLVGILALVLVLNALFGSGFNKEGYRRPTLIAAFYRNRLGKLAPPDHETKFYVMNLVGAARDNCGNIDGRIANAILRDEMGSSLDSRDAMAEKGGQILMNLMQDLAHPDQLIRDTMNDQVAQSDAECDIALLCNVLAAMSG